MVALPHTRRLPAFSWHAASLFVATIALWLASIELPGPPDIGLDLSWQAALVDAYLHGRPFGSEVVFTYGPWSFLALSGYAPAAIKIRLLWEIFGRLAYSATVVALSAALPGVRRWVFLAAFIAVACFFETSALAIITVTALAWLLPRNAAPWQRALAIAWLSFFAHFKFVFCLQAAAAMVITVALRCAERRFRAGLGLALAFFSAYAGWWIAAGQNLANLPAFWRQNTEISSGYSWAMGIDPSTSTLLAGLLVVALCGGFLWLLARADLPRTQRVGAALILGASWLAAWKQGFTRADLHVVGFFVFCLLVGLALPGLFGRRRWCWQDANVAACLLGVTTLASSILWSAPRSAWDHWLSLPRELVHLRQWPLRFADSLRIAQDAARDPALQSIVGRGTVDVLNYEQGLAILNRLNYRPRPVIQSYSAYTPALLRADWRFFQSERAPDFVVVNLATIDGHYPAQDDALALAEFARSYEVARVDANFALLRRKAAPPKTTDFARQSLARHVPHYGDEIPVPDGNGHPVWLEADFQPTLLGRLRAFLYHAPNPNMVVTCDDGRPKTFRIVPTTAGDGFFVCPLIENHHQFAALVRGRGANWPRTIRFELANPSDAWFWRRPRVQFSAFTELPLVHTDKLDELVEAHAVNVRPLSAHSDVALDFVAVGDHALLFAHATSEVVLPVPPGSHRLTGGCGFLEGAYTAGRTDGADFSVEALLRDGTAIRLLQRSLDPIARASDRGFQPFGVDVPAGATQLRLRIGPGARGDGSWDWTYWGDLQVLP